MRVLFIGDIVGATGIRMVEENLARLRTTEKIDVVIANGENAANKNGITEQIYRRLCLAGVDIVTLGNHAFDRTEVYDTIMREEYLLRPANYPKSVPGKGYAIYDMGREQLGVVNVMGNVFISSLQSPFEMIDELIQEMTTQGCKNIVIDFHGEATSEKIAFGYYMDGKVALIVGTHTHVQTADEKILSHGSGYITDVGMTGPYESVLGVVKEASIERFMTQLPVRFEQAEGRGQFNAVIADIGNGKTTAIKRINFVENK